MIFISTITYSQNNYIEYYNLINKAKEYNKNDKIDSSLIVIKEAFKLVDYIHIDNLKFAKKISKKNKDKDFYEYCQTKLNNQKKLINISLKEKIDSLGKKDQNIRDRKHLKARDYYYKCKYDTTFDCNNEKFTKSEKILKEWWLTDSLNIVELKKIIKIYGYPGEKLVGKESNLSANIILLHYDKDTANHIMGDILNNALINGNIQPRMYARIIDRHLMSAGKPQKYYAIPTPWVEMSEMERKDYNKNRYAIGMKGLQKMIIKKRKNSVSVTYED